MNLFVAIVLFGFSTATASIKDEYMRQQARAGADVQNEEEEDEEEDNDDTLEDKKLRNDIRSCQASEAPMSRPGYGS